MKLMNLKTLTVLLILTILISAAFWLYIERDIARFEASLPTPPAVETPRETATPTHPAEIRQDIHQNAETAFPGFDIELEPSESVTTQQDLDTAGGEDVSTGPTDLDSFFPSQTR